MKGEWKEEERKLKEGKSMYKKNIEWGNGGRLKEEEGEEGLARLDELGWCFRRQRKGNREERSRRRKYNN